LYNPLIYPGGCERLFVFKNRLWDMGLIHSLILATLGGVVPTRWGRYFTPPINFTVGLIRTINTAVATNEIIATEPKSVGSGMDS